MKRMEQRNFLLTVSVSICLLASFGASAQRVVHWQVNPKGFPGDTTILVDVNDGNVFRRDLPVSAFMLSMDEFAGEQGGWIINQQQAVSGQVGVQVLIMIDRSRTFTSEFGKAKRIMKTIVDKMDPNRDQIAIATAPAQGGYSEAKLEQTFTNNKTNLKQVIDRIKPLSSGDKSGARLCQALSESLRWFETQAVDKYRVVVVLTGGADKGEGKGDCVQQSYSHGKVPFFPIVLKLDRKFDDPRNSHKIENNTHELAKQTGGSSIFRRSESSYNLFVGIMWNRIRSQYHLRVNFPCYRPMPVTEHWSVLKVEGRDVDGIKFKATSAPPPQPQITAIYPQQATRKDVDDGRVELTVDGKGFCGPPGRVKVMVGNRQLPVKSQNPFRVVASLGSSVETDTVTVVNQFGQNGESPMKFEIVKAPKGAEASLMLTIIVVGIVLLAVISIVLISLRSRKAKVDIPSSAPAMTHAPSREATGASRAAKTVAMGAVSEAKLVHDDGRTFELGTGQNLIGRETTCRVKLDASGISREHARLFIDENSGLVTIEDLGSTNGTYYGTAGAEEKDLKRVEQQQPLRSGDIVWICGERLTFSFDIQSQGTGEG